MITKTEVCALSTQSFQNYPSNIFFSVEGSFIERKPLFVKITKFTISLFETSYFFYLLPITDDGMQRLYDEGVDMLSSPIVTWRFSFLLITRFSQYTFEFCYLPFHNPIQSFYPIEALLKLLLQHHDPKVHVHAVSEFRFWN